MRNWTEEQIEAERQRRRQESEYQAEVLLENLAWLVDCGETHCDQLAARFGIKASGLHRQLHRIATAGRSEANALSERIDWSAMHFRTNRKAVSA